MNYELTIRDYLKLAALALCMLAGGIELADPPRSKPDPGVEFSRLKDACARAGGLSFNRDTHTYTCYAPTMGFKDRDEAARKLCRAKRNTGVLPDIECL